MVKKRFVQELKRLARFKNLSESERILFAMSLSATPDERWRRHETFLRSHGLLKRYKPKGSVSK